MDIDALAADLRRALLDIGGDHGVDLRAWLADSLATLGDYVVEVVPEISGDD